MIRLCRNDGKIDRVSVNLGRVDLLSRLVDLLEDLVELEAAGYDPGGLGVEGDLVLVDSCYCEDQSPGCSMQGASERYVPSSFFRARSTAPEQPPQLMATLNS